jgi:hypothetical protein
VSLGGAHCTPYPPEIASPRELALQSPSLSPPSPSLCCLRTSERKRQVITICFISSKRKRQLQT